MPVSQPFSSLAVRGDVVVVTLRGDVCASAQGRLEDVLAAACALAETAVVVDLGAVEYIDRHGARPLVDAHVEGGRAGQSVAVAAPSRYLSHLLSLIGLDLQVPVYASVRQAVNCYSRTGLRLVPQTGAAPVVSHRRRPGSSVRTG